MKRRKRHTNKVVNSNTGETTYYDSRTGEVRRRWWTKARTPGEVRDSRKPGGPGFRNNWEGEWDGGFYVAQ